MWHISRISTLFCVTLRCFVLECVLAAPGMTGRNRGKQQRGNGLEKRFSGRWLFIVTLIIAIACIAAGAYNAWRSFQRFDESILIEKDSQLYSLMRSDDINIENSISSFVREAETFMARARVNKAISEWRSTGETDAVTAEIRENSLRRNPVYADMLFISRDRIRASDSGNTEYAFITARDGSGMRICTNEGGNYYLAYEHDVSSKVRFDSLMSLSVLYDLVNGTNPDRKLVLLDASGSVLMMTRDGKTAVTEAAGDEDGKGADGGSFIIECQNDNRSDGMMLEMSDGENDPYTARMVVLPSGSTVNGEFAMGIIANYEETIRPSRTAAKQILLYAGLAIAGVLALIIIILFMSRVNSASSAELRTLRKKNEVMEEINQRMQVLAHHQRLETIGTMTASIAHDFNNLLTPIMGYSIMTMEMLPPDAVDLQENLNEIYDASVKAKDIVTRLADLSKKGSEANYTDIEIDEVIQSALKVTLPAKPKNVEVKASFDAEGVLIKADRTQISQLVMNIVLNAYDAMRKEGGTVMVSTRQSGDEILMRFKDTGCGMDADTLTRIFDPFYTTKESGKGTGLGLAIVAQIVETHGGRIYVESHPGEGTEFRIYIPCAGADADPLSWGADGEGRYDTKRYSAKLFRQELARAEAEKQALENEE